VTYSFLITHSFDVDLPRQCFEIFDEIFHGLMARVIGRGPQD